MQGDDEDAATGEEEGEEEECDGLPVEAGSMASGGIEAGSMASGGIEEGLDMEGGKHGEVGGVMEREATEEAVGEEVAES